MEQVPTRAADAGERITRAIVALTLELAGFPGDDEEAQAIADGVAFAINECDPEADDLETLAATAGAFMDNVNRENHGR